MDPDEDEDYESYMRRLSALGEEPPDVYPWNFNDNLAQGLRELSVTESDVEPPTDDPTDGFAPWDFVETAETAETAETPSDAGQGNSRDFRYNTPDPLTEYSLSTPTPPSPTTQRATMAGDHSNQREQIASPDNAGQNQPTPDQLARVLGGLPGEDQPVDGGEQREGRENANIPTQTPALTGLGLGSRSTQRQRNVPQNYADFNQLSRQGHLNLRQGADNGGQPFEDPATSTTPTQTPVMTGSSRRSNQRRQNTASAESLGRVSGAWLSSLGQDDEPGEKRGQPKGPSSIQGPTKPTTRTIRRGHDAGQGSASNQGPTGRVTRSTRRGNDASLDDEDARLEKSDKEDKRFDQRLARSLTPGADPHDIVSSLTKLDSDPEDNGSDSDETYQPGRRPRPQAPKHDPKVSKQAPRALKDISKAPKPVPKAPEQAPNAPEQVSKAPPEAPKVPKRKRKGQRRIEHDNGSVVVEDVTPDEEEAPRPGRREPRGRRTRRRLPREDDDLIFDEGNQACRSSRTDEPDEEYEDGPPDPLDDEEMLKDVAHKEKTRKPIKPRDRRITYEAWSDSEQDDDGHSPVRVFEWSLPRPGGKEEKGRLRLENPKRRKATPGPRGNQYAMTEEGVMAIIDSNDPRASRPHTHRNDEEPKLRFYREPTFKSEFEGRKEGPIVNVLPGATPSDGWTIWISAHEFARPGDLVIAREAEGTLATPIRLNLKRGISRKLMVQKRLRVVFNVERLVRIPDYMVGIDVEFGTGSVEGLWEPIRQLVPMVPVPYVDRSQNKNIGQSTKGKGKDGVDEDEFPSCMF